MIGITIDNNEASTLICFSEKIGPNNQPNIMSLVHDVDSFSSANDCNNIDYNANNGDYNNEENGDYNNEENGDYNNEENGDYNTYNDNAHESNGMLVKGASSQLDEHHDDSAFHNNNQETLSNNDNTDSKNLDHTSLINHDIIPHNNNMLPNDIDLIPNHNNYIDLIPNHNNYIDQKNRKRPRKSKPYSNSQLVGGHDNEEGFEQQQNNIVIKQEVDDDFLQATFDDNNHPSNNIEWPTQKVNNNNIPTSNNNIPNNNIPNNNIPTSNNNIPNNNIPLSNNNSNSSNNNLNNNPIENSNNNPIENFHNNLIENSNNNAIENSNQPDQVGGDTPAPERKKWKGNVRSRKPNRKYADAHLLSESLPLDAATYLEQHTSGSMPTTDMINSIKDNSSGSGGEYNHLMQGICDFVMSQSQHVDDKSRPQSRTCHICQATLSNPLSLKNHIQGTHLALKLRRCNLCGETFKWTMQLARHKKRMHGGSEFVPIYNVT